STSDGQDWRQVVLLQRSQLRKLAPHDNPSDRGQVELLMNACARRALAGDKADCELVLSMIYSEVVFTRKLAEQWVPEIYASNPHEFAICFMKQMLLRDTFCKKYGEKQSDNVPIANPAVCYALCYHLKKYGMEMAK